MADQYLLKVTAGPTYTDQKPVPVNIEQPTRVNGEHVTADITVRIQNYRGLPRGSPQSSPYFEQDPHKQDLYSIRFNFTPKQDINGHDLVFGNDFDHPIRDKLPPGFQQAFNLVKWFIDPGIYGDVNADHPYLYGPLLSSVNVLRVGPKDDRAQERLEESRANEEVQNLEEGAEADGQESRTALGIPGDAAGRKKFFLAEQHLKDFTFEKNRTYENDFFNPYLDFNDFALRLPGFGIIPGLTIPIISYWDGQPLRYVLKNRSTDKELFVIVFTLIPKDQVDEQGNVMAKKEEGSEGSKETEADDVD